MNTNCALGNELGWDIKIPNSWRRYRSYGETNILIRRHSIPQFDFFFFLWKWVIHSPGTRVGAIYGKPGDVDGQEYLKRRQTLPDFVKFKNGKNIPHRAPLWMIEKHTFYLFWFPWSARLISFKGLLIMHHWLSFA